MVSALQTKWEESHGVKIFKGSSCDLFQGGSATFDLRDFEKPKQTAVGTVSSPAQNLKCRVYMQNTAAEHDSHIM